MSGGVVEPMLFEPTWPAPARVGACFTTRRGGFSAEPWDTFNLATHVDDDRDAVARNRDLLSCHLGPGVTPCWMEQVHGDYVARLDEPPRGLCADAAITRVPGLACVVMVADCVPILLCTANGDEVAAVHAGWRGLAAGIVARTVASFATRPSRLLAWVGPCIGADAYVVDASLRTRFLTLDAGAETCFQHRSTRWHLDLHALARRQLDGAGVGAVHGAPCCVHADAERFYSYRRDGVTGRMAALIWIRPDRTVVSDATPLGTPASRRG
ncbi:MAG: peptidoglycan editing factor PgeF [Gammaproteobacteria bacterium]